VYEPSIAVYPGQISLFVSHFEFLTVSKGHSILKVIPDIIGKNATAAEAQHSQQQQQQQHQQEKKQ
jgi:hypothetical protein